MSPDYATLDRVNEEVNAGVTYTPDAEQFHAEDWWEDVRASRRGDCDDYAVSKLCRLLELGWPKDGLRLAIVGVETPGDHAVLCARTDDGRWWVLDNRYPHPSRPTLLPYSWVSWGLGREWCSVSWS